MRFGLDGKRTCLMAITVAIICLIMAASSQSAPRLRVTVGDTTGSAGEHNSVVTVYLQNTMEQIFAFELWLQLTRPDVCLFQTELDTVVDTTYWFCSEWDGEACTDSITDTLPDYPPPYDFLHVDTVEAFVGNLDTVGTLMGGWEYVQTRSLGGNGADIKVSAISDRDAIPGSHPPIGPGSGVLFRLLADILPIPDTMQDRMVTIRAMPFLNNFNFSRPDGTSIGIKTVTVPDTNYYVCRSWAVPPYTGCLDYDRVPPEECDPSGCDSIYVQMVDVGVLDTDSVQLIDGSLTVDPWLCGDVNSSGDITILDINIMVDYLYIHGAYDPIYNPSGITIEPMERANANCSEEVDTITIGDINALIDHLYITQDPLCCQY